MRKHSKVELSVDFTELMTQSFIFNSQVGVLNVKRCKINNKYKLLTNERYLKDRLIESLSNDKDKFKDFVDSMKTELTVEQQKSILNNVKEVDYINSIVETTIDYLLHNYTLEKLYKEAELDISKEIKRYFSLVNNLDQALKHTEWTHFVIRWNEGDCSKTEWDNTKESADNLNDAVSKLTQFTNIQTSQKAQKIKGEITANVKGGANDDDVLKLTRIQLALSNPKNCIFDENNEFSCTKATSLENFINYNIIKPDLIDIVSMVCDRILYGDWGNCYFVK